MKIQFDGALSYQQEAIDAIVDIFKGQETCESNFTVYSPEFIAKQDQIAYKASFTDLGGKNGQIDHHFPVQIDHRFRCKLTT
jgi:type III restriction enzyme